MTRMTLCSFVLASAAAPAPGLTMLYDFETDNQIQQWQIRSAGQDTFGATAKFATSGRRSAVFHTPKWRQGMQEWPAFEVQPPVRDWSKADRLLIDLVNPSNHSISLKLFISDSKTSFRNGLSTSVALGPRSHHRVLIPLSRFPKGIDRKDVAVLHFFTTRPPSDFVVHLDTIALLGKNEPPPAYPAALNKELIGLMIPPETIRRAQADLDGLERRLDDLVPKTSPARPWFDQQLHSRRSAIDRCQAACRDGSLSLKGAADLRDQLQQRPSGRLESLAALAKTWTTQGGNGGYLVGVATSMEKVLPRDVSPAMRITKKISICLARNETESFQVIVLPLARALKQVRVAVDEFTSDAALPGPGCTADVRVVGYVKTARPAYTVSYVGWWPDPLLDFLPAVDVAAGDAQAFWVRLRAPKTCTPGTYRSKVHVRCGQGALCELELEARVYGFAVPDCSPLPTAMSVYTQFPPKFGGGKWRPSKAAWVDFLADYYIDWDSLYRSDAPDFPMLRRLESQGRLGAFNLRYFNHGPFNPKQSEEALDRAITRLIDSVRGIHQRTKHEGLADKAYLYGFDERGKEYFPVLQKIAARVKKAVPGVKVMTTTYDHSFGLKSGITAIDAWVPLTPRYDPVRAAKARAHGKKVWWYICCGPAHPYANWFVEYPAIEARLLMGAMTAKYRPDGFLYYAITRWPNNSKPIETGPFTTWNPASYKTYNGDGSLLCPGPGGKPLATIRLENFRDGLEDYAYVRVLEATIEAKEATESAQLSQHDKAWLRRAREAMAVPEALVKDMRRFTDDPNVLYEYRNRIADAISRVGMRPVEPWAK